LWRSCFLEVGSVQFPCFPFLICRKQWFCSCRWSDRNVQRIVEESYWPLPTGMHHLLLRIVTSIFTMWLC
jgi:hypothetical protein